MTFPRDSYTPFGYLANPYHSAHSWSAAEGGLLRSHDTTLGFGWVEPTARKPDFNLGITLAVRWNDRLYRLRGDFARLGLDSRHHSSRLFSYDFRLDQAAVSVGFALADRNLLVARIEATNPIGLPREFELFLLAELAGTSASWHAQAIGDGWRFHERASGRDLVFVVGAAGGVSVSPREIAATMPELLVAGNVVAGLRIPLDLPPGAASSVSAVLLRDSADLTPARDVVRMADSVVAERRAEDDAFYSETALPVGDWPGEWKRGWIYDLETTRSCLFPSGGIFHDEWPSWMISWPRVVVAEGCLDASRFSYAAPEQALRLAQTIFADAPAANVPCVFAAGEPNMVAKDGTVCGTSPAWCLPFYNLWLLYLRTGDRAWLTDLVPRLEAYLDYWRRERTDDAGWIVYKCTWEAGEDCTPRLDPAEEGDEVISRYVRPIELQATFSQSAAILARFAREVGDGVRFARWSAVAEDYAARTQGLWDEAAGRFRDWDKRSNTFLASTGKLSYWKTDPVRYSPLSLTPIVAGLATAEQRGRLRAEIERYDVAPWCLWPSWSFVVAEAASVAGWFDFAGRFAARIVDRVYRANDRRTLAEAPRPTPGTAPEFWPLDLSDFNGSDGYGWGATTTSLWVRQIFGFLEGEDPSEFSFILAPSLPPDLLQTGRRYGFRHLPYRGARLDLAYEVSSRGLDAVVKVTPARAIQAVGHTGPIEVQHDPEAHRFRFPIEAQVATRVLIGDRE